MNDETEHDGDPWSQWENEVEKGADHYMKFIESEIANAGLVKLSVMYADQVSVIPFHISLIESVRLFAVQTPEFGKDDDKRNIYLFENDSISLAFRTAKERFNPDGTRTLFVMVRDLTDAGSAVQVQGCVWDFKQCENGF